MRRLFFVISCFGCLLTQPTSAGVWQSVGSYGFATSPSRVYLDLSIDDTPYLSYVENKDWGGGCCNYKSVISKYDKGAQDWLMVGPAGFGANYSGTAPIAIRKDSQLFASADKAMYKLNDNTWSTVGNEISNLSYYRTMILGGNDAPYLGFPDSARGMKASVIAYDGSGWNYVGGQGFSAGSLESYGPPALAINKNELYAAYVESKDWGGGCCTWKLTVSKFDTSLDAWVSVGSSGISTAFPYTPSLAFDLDNSPVVAFTLQDSGVATYKFDGVSWNILSPSGASGMTYLAADKNGKIYLAAGGTFTSSNDVWRYNGTNWSSLGYVSGPVQGLKVSKDGTPYVALGAIGGGGPISVVRYMKEQQAALQVIASKTDLIINETATLTTSGGSGTGPVSYKATGPCSLAGNTVTAMGVGTCSIIAEKDGDDGYLPTISAPVSIDVLLERKRSLSVSKAGAGTITSIPEGISCGAMCTAQFLDGSTVSLIAKPDNGYAFAGWGDACSGTGTCAVTMSGDKSVSATFTELPKYPVTVKRQSGGVVSSDPNGILCGGSNKQCVSSFSYAKLTATPNPGYEFIRWNGCPSPSANICSITPTSKMTLSAVFKKLPKYNLKVTKNTLGSVTSNPAGLKCPDKKKSCSAKFTKGTQVTLTPVPQAGRTFGGWTGACSGQDACTLLMDGNKGVGAKFQ